jgi:hypothetical protein
MTRSGHQSFQSRTPGQIQFPNHTKAVTYDDATLVGGPNFVQNELCRMKSRNALAVWGQT